MKGVCSYFCCGACARNAGSEPAGCVRYLSDVARRGMLPHRTCQEATPSVFFKFTHRTDTSSRPLLSRHSPHRRRAESTMPSELHVQLQSSEIASGTSAPRDRTQHTPPSRQDAHQCSLRLVVHVKRHINIATKHSCLSFQAENHLSIQTFGLNHDFVLSFYRFFHFGFSFFSVAVSRFFELLISFFRVHRPWSHPCVLQWNW